MGATTFTATASGRNAREAFQAARAEAQRAFGDEGYTGSIAEKDSFVMIPLPAGADPLREANKLIEAMDRRIADKWGPAGCFDLGNGQFYFFGWASE